MNACTRLDSCCGKKMQLFVCVFAVHFSVRSEVNPSSVFFVCGHHACAQKTKPGEMAPNIGGDWRCLICAPLVPECMQIVWSVIASCCAQATDSQKLERSHPGHHDLWVVLLFQQVRFAWIEVICVCKCIEWGDKEIWSQLERDRGHKLEKARGTQA